MQTDVAEAEANPRLKQFYGFDPTLEYVIRSRSRKYNGVTLARYRFASGECIAPKMRQDATKQQKWDRGSRIQWFNQNDGYAVYLRGEQPAADLEPFWFGQEVPDEAALPDSGEEDQKWEAAPRRFDSTPLDPPEKGFPADFTQDTGEARPEPVVTRRKKATPTDGDLPVIDMLPPEAVG